MDKEKVLANIDQMKKDKSKRNSRIETYVSVANLEDPRTGSRYSHGITNFPAAALNLGIFFLSAGNLKVRLAAAKEKPKERDEFSAAERAIIGIGRVVDEEYRRMGEPTSRRRANADDILKKGSVYNLTCVVPADDGKTPIFVATRWNPETCYPTFVNTTRFKGMGRFVHEYKCSLEEWEEKQKELGLSNIELVGKKEVTISDYYERVYEDGKPIVPHLMLADNEIVLEEDYLGGSKEAFDEIPVKYASPYADERGFLEPALSQIDDYNEIKSVAMQAASLQIKQLIAIQSDEENLKLDKDKYLDSDVTIVQGTNLDIKSVDILKGFPEMVSLLGEISGNMQRVLFPYTTWGDIRSREISGYLYSQLRQGAFANVGPFHESLNSIDSDVYGDWLRMYKKGSFGPIKVSGNYTGRYDGFFHDNFTRKNVPNFMYVEVLREMAFPENKLQLLSAMSTALPGRPLLDMTTALEEIWGDDDPEITMGRMAEDKARDMLTPLNVAIKALEFADKYEAQGNRQLANLIRMQAQAILNPQQQQQGTPTRQRASRPEFGGLQEQQPSEDELRSQMGQPPNRPVRPTNVRQRLAAGGLDQGRGV